MSDGDLPTPGPSLIDRLQAGLGSSVTRGWKAVAGAIQAARGIDWRATAIAEMTRLPKSLTIPSLALISIPLTIALGADLLASNRSATPPRSGGFEQPDRERRARMAAAFAGIDAPTIGDVMETVAQDLPAGLALHRIGAGSDGHVELAIDTNDPDDLRTKLRSVPSLGEFRQVDQEQGEPGVRVVLAGRLR